MTPFMYSRFVVSAGNPVSRSKRSWRPKTLRVPTPVRSFFLAPFSRMSRIRSRYCCMKTFLRVHARIGVHFGASAGRADARRRDAGDVVTSSRSGNAADARPPPRPSGLRPAGPLAVLLAPYIPQRVCSSLAPCQRAWGPAAKCTRYFLTGPNLRAIPEKGRLLGLSVVDHYNMPSRTCLVAERLERG